MQNATSILKDVGQCKITSQRLNAALQVAASQCEPCLLIPTFASVFAFLTVASGLGLHASKQLGVVRENRQILESIEVLRVTAFFIAVNEELGLVPGP